MYQIAYKPENVQQIIIQVAYKEEILQSQMTKQNLLCDSFQKYISHLHFCHFRNKYWKIKNNKT